MKKTSWDLNPFLAFTGLHRSILGNDATHTYVFDRMGWVRFQENREPRVKSGPGGTSNKFD